MPSQETMHPLMMPWRSGRTLLHPSMEILSTERCLFLILSSLYRIGLCLSSGRVTTRCVNSREVIEVRRVSYDELELNRHASILMTLMLDRIT